MVERRAFTLIELLIVIVIMVILSGMLLATINLMRGDVDREKTKAIMAAVRNSLDLTKSATGSLSSPVAHPLAGSKAPRFAFKRGGITLDSIGEALLAPVLASVTGAASNRVLDPSDIFVDERAPQFCGLPRSQMKILGADLATVSEYRRLPHPAAGTPTLPSPYTSATYPDAEFLRVADGTAVDVKRSLDFIFSSGNNYGELQRLGGLTAPPETGGTLIFNDRLWTEAASAENRWEPGFINDCTGTARGGAGWSENWYPYRLPHLAVYDAWGNEILYMVEGNGAVKLVSAGADCSFVWDLGDDQVLQTDPLASSPTGDDRDGRADNVIAGVGE